VNLTAVAFMASTALFALGFIAFYVNRTVQLLASIDNQLGNVRYYLGNIEQRLEKVEGKLHYIENHTRRVVRDQYEADYQADLACD
jgi:hypothetical protein